MTDAPRNYPDLHEHLAALKKRGLAADASTGRSTRTRSCIRWCAGSSSAASRSPSARRSCSPTSSTGAGRKYDMPGRGRRRSPPTARSTASACGAPLERDPGQVGPRDRQSGRSRAWSTKRAVPGSRDRGRGAERRGQRARPAADPDLDAGLRQRADADRDQRDHARSGNRHAEHGHLPRGAESAGPAGGAHGDARRRRRRLSALSQAPEARRQDHAVRDRARLPALRRVRGAAEAAARPRRDRRRGRRSPAGRSTSCARRRSTCWCRPRPRS